MDFFGVPWEDLTLDGLRAFLDGADDEGVTWEAKGPDPNHPEARFEARHVYRSVCGLANTLGGFVVVGASRDDEDAPWTLPGVRIPHAEPKTWLADAVTTLRPRPRFESHAWDVGDGRTAAVVAVEPVAVPPCMTAGGEIYERVSSKTVRVTDPLVLARLLERGDAARRGAEEGAKAAVRVAIGDDSLRRDELFRVVVAMRATGYEPDISSRLFRRSTTDAIAEIVKARLKSDRDTYVHAANPFWRQDRYGVRTVKTDPPPDYQPPPRAWSVAVGWDGSVSLRCAAGDRGLGIALLFEDILVPAWNAAVDLVDLVGGFGDAYFVSELAGGGVVYLGDEWGGVKTEIGGSRLIGRWTEITSPSEELVDSVRRELLRSLTFPAHEPEPAL